MRIQSRGGARFRIETGVGFRIQHRVQGSGYRVDKDYGYSVVDK